MKVTGKITKVLDVQEGTSKADKAWKKMSFIVETTEMYNNVYCFELFGEDKVDNFIKFNKVGQEVDVDFNVNTSEWKGKYYTSLSAWKIFKAAVSSEPIEAEKQEDDLPF